MTYPHEQISPLIDDRPDYFVERQRHLVKFIRAALAEAGWPDAQVDPVGDFAISIRNDDPGHPPRAVATKAVELASQSLGVELRSVERHAERGLELYLRDGTTP